MSQVKISGNASGTGVLTIAAPNTNTDRSITIPDKAGAIAVGAGTIVQVVTATTTTQTATTSTSFVDTALSASITPTSSSNKVLVMVDGAIGSANSAGGSIINIVRGSTVLQYKGAQYVGVTNINISNQAMILLDSPATTSATTYKVQIVAQSASSQATFNYVFTGYTAPTANITLMEVVA
jgi:hypothetical protein